MAYKDIVVYLDNYRGAAARLQLAVTLASRHKAHLVGFYGFDLPRAPLSRIVAGMYVEDNAALASYTRERDAAFDDAAHCEAAFHNETRRAGLKGEWQICPDSASDLSALVTERARYADLTILAQVDSDHPGLDAIARLPETVMLGCGRPVIIVPYAGRIEDIGRNVLIAWNGTREAARAVRDALPLLHAAEAVTIVSIAPRHDAKHETEAPARLAAYLAEHDIRAEASYVVSNDIEAGELILSRAADLGSDLIVMGGYGHSRTRELLLGGVTRAVLSHMTVPVLMSH